MTTIEITPQLQLALDFLEDSNQHVFITGRAGTGKSTLLNHFKATTKKNIAILAPTGVAALNVGGQTLHSFFKFKPDITPESVGLIKVGADQAKLYKILDTIIIDEASMVRADLLDCMDRFLRLHGPKKSFPFGGIQIVFIGDLYQLPPVVTTRDRELFHSRYKGPYFFHASVINEIPLYLVELTKIYRQKDQDFIEILNAIRNNVATPAHLELLNRQYSSHEDSSDFVIALTTTNELADTINLEHLQRLETKTFHYAGVSTGSFSEKDFPTQQAVNLKKGAQVMTLTNDPNGQWVNGSIGKITNIIEDPEESAPVVEVLLESGRKIRILPFTWELFKYVFNQETNHLETQTVGTFRQYPLRLAWAVTIHKSQGKTFDRAIINLGRGTFSPGQLYVALSRCRTLEGITLKQPIIPRYIITDSRIKEFFTSFTDGLRQVGQSNMEFDEWGA